MKEQKKIIIAGFQNRKFSTIDELKPENMENETITEELEKGASNTTYKLPELPYAYDAMEPYIDKMTMEIHHDKHHSGYVNNLNKALEGLKYLPTSLDELLKNISKYNLTIKNNAGGHYNHSLFWKIMKFKGGGVPSGKLLEAINTSFGSFENFKNKFNEAATKIFGSGWAWLVVKDGKLEIGITQNQDNPLMDTSEFKGTPILCVDIWEHAYYLNYQNKRSEYIANWWNVLNWEEIQNIYENNK